MVDPKRTGKITLCEKVLDSTIGIPSQIRWVHASLCSPKSKDGVGIYYQSEGLEWELSLLLSQKQWHDSLKIAFCRYHARIIALKMHQRELVDYELINGTYPNEHGFFRTLEEVSRDESIGTLADIPLTVMRSYNLSEKYVGIFKRTLDRYLLAYSRK